MWTHPRKGTLVTLLFPEGEVREMRVHQRDEATSQSEVGRIPAKSVAALQAAARLILTRPSTFPSGATTEGFSLAIQTGASPLPERWVNVQTLAADPAMSAFRQQVLTARAQAEGGRFAWRSLAGRLFFLLLAVSLGICWLIVRDWRAGDRLERTAERVSGTVVQREGKSGFDQDKSIRVRLVPSHGPAQEAKIKQYLSAENWASASVGSTVQLLYLPSENQTFVASDILRWQHDKKWIPLFPLLLVLLGLSFLIFFPRYRVGAHSDGQEYLVVGDTVVGDDKDLPVSRLTLNITRFLWKF